MALQSEKVSRFWPVNVPVPIIRRVSLWTIRWVGFQADFRRESYKHQWLVRKYENTYRKVKDTE